MRLKLLIGNGLLLHRYAREILACILDGQQDGIEIERLLIRYRSPGQEYATAELELNYGDLFRGFIPARKVVPPAIEYYVEGVTFSGGRAPLFKDASSPAMVEVADPDAPKFVPQGGAEARSWLEEELLVYSAEDAAALNAKDDAKAVRTSVGTRSFGREEIRALGARTVYDVLDAMPGLSVSRDVQGFHHLAVRGLRSDPEVLLLLDGHKLNSFYDGKALANLPVENIERIEISYGPGSAASGAFLAQVNMVTRPESDAMRGSVSGGSFGTAGGHLSASKGLGSLSLRADAAFVRQDGYAKPIAKDALDKQTSSQADPALRGAGDPVGFTHDEGLLLNAGAAVEYDLGNAGKLGAGARFLNEDRSALVGLFDTAGRDSRLLWQAIMADLSWERPFGNGSLRAQGRFDQQDTSRQFQLALSNYRDG